MATNINIYDLLPLLSKSKERAHSNVLLEKVVRAQFPEKCSIATLGRVFSAFAAHWEPEVSVILTKGVCKQWQLIDI
jgi:hypothetical protein